MGCKVQCNYGRAGLKKIWEQLPFWTAATTTTISLSINYTEAIQDVINMAEKVGKQGTQNNYMKLNQSGALSEYMNEYKCSIIGIMYKLWKKKTIKKITQTVVINIVFQSTFFI